MGLIAVPAAELATVVTTLEMTARPALRPLPPSPLRLARWEQCDPDKYRTLFRRVGAPWLWYSRLVMEDAALRRIIHDPQVAVHAVQDAQGIEVGMLELDFREAGQCGLAYVGLVPELTGRGNGRWLMANALALGWRKGIERLWVNTCTLDHPSALPFYRASGFVAVRRTIETFPEDRKSVV